MTSRALALLLLLWPTGEAAACRVTRAVDGDTLSLACSGQPERRTRMWGIQAPENWPLRKGPVFPVFPALSGSDRFNEPKGTPFSATAPGESSEAEMRRSH